MTKKAKEIGWIALGIVFLVGYVVVAGVGWGLVDNIGSWVIGSVTSIFVSQSQSGANTAGHWTSQFKQGTIEGCIQQGHTQPDCTCYTNYVSQKYSTDYALKIAKTNGWSQVDKETIEACFNQ